jgi:hypothetical protein
VVIMNDSGIHSPWTWLRILRWVAMLLPGIAQAAAAAPPGDGWQLIFAAGLSAQRHEAG